MPEKNEKKEDLRIRRTRKLLCNAMLELLETKSFDEISVVEICDKAMVHRATFYKHFEDKYTFMSYICREKLEEFYNSGIKDKKITTPREIYSSIVDRVVGFVDTNENMFKISVTSNSSSQFSRAITNTVYDEILSLLNVTGSDANSDAVPREIVAQFLTGGFMNLITSWVLNWGEMTAHEIAGYIKNMIFMSRSNIDLDKEICLPGGAK